LLSPPRLEPKSTPTWEEEGHQSFDLFSLRLSSGYTIERKSLGKKIDWNQQQNSKPRVPMAPVSYLEREQLISKTLNTIFKEGTQNARRTNFREEGAGLLAASGEDGAPGRKLAGVEDRRATREPSAGQNR
jgi:hypothetical protein